MANDSKATEGKGRDRTRPRLKVFELGEHAGLSASDAKKVLERAVREIPDEQLRNFRGGQILVMM